MLSGLNASWSFSEFNLLFTLFDSNFVLITVGGAVLAWGISEYEKVYGLS